MKTIISVVFVIALNVFLISCAIKWINMETGFLSIGWGLMFEVAAMGSACTMGFIGLMIGAYLLNVELWQTLFGKPSEGIPSMTNPPPPPHRRFDKTDVLVTYIYENMNVAERMREPPVPTTPQTKQWMENHGIEPADKEALILKYLERAFHGPPTYQQTKP